MKNTVDSQRFEVDLIELFLNEKREAGRHESTLERYAYLIKLIVSSIGKPIRYITDTDIRNYFSDRKNKGWSLSSVYSTCSVLVIFYDWVCKKGFVEVNPASSVFLELGN